MTAKAQLLPLETFGINNVAFFLGQQTAFMFLLSSLHTETVKLKLLPSVIPIWFCE